MANITSPTPGQVLERIADPTTLKLNRAGIQAAVDPTSGAAVGLVDGSGALNKIFMPSSKYKFFIPGKQFVTSGAAKDQSGNLADAAISSTYTDAAAWANNGYITTVASAASSGKLLSIPASKSAIDLGTTSFIFSALINKASPAGNDSIFGNGLTAGGTYGWYLSNRTGGAIRPVFYTTTGVFSSLADSTVLFADGADHVIACAYDAVTKQVFLWRDGALTNTYNSTGISGSTPPVRGFAIGSSADDGNGANASFDLKTNGVHLLAFLGGLPINVGALVQAMAATPGRYISDSQIQM